MNAVDELIEAGFDPDVAELMAAAEEDGTVFDLETGKELAVNPDGPIEYAGYLVAVRGTGGATVSRLITLGALVFVLTGCLSDPFGASTRTQIRADGVVGVATQDRLAREAEARALVDAEAERQYGQSHRTATWAMVLPVLMLVAVAGAIVWTVVNWRGRIALERVRQQACTPPAHQVGQRSEYQQLRDYARSYGAELLFVRGKPAMRLPDGRRMLIVKQEVEQ